MGQMRLLIQNKHAIDNRPKESLFHEISESIFKGYIINGLGPGLSYECIYLIEMYLYELK